jgi:ABC-type uncharacterized transport system substrate-binding protein
MHNAAFLPMRRREFITLLGGLAAWPLTVRAQQPSKLATIGFLGANTAELQSKWTTAFVERLRELGWVEGRNISIEYRWADGRFDRSPEFITEFVRLKADVIVTHATANVLAAKRGTSTVPIVFTSVADPVGNNLVTSLARPGGNITGLSAVIPDIVGKRLEMLREIIPGLRRLAILFNSSAQNVVLEVQEVQAMAGALGFETVTAKVRTTDDIWSTVEALKARSDALYVQGDPLFTTNRVRFNTLALQARLPTIHSTREQVEAGGLISYGTNISDLFRRAGDYVDKVLRGASPGEIPIEQPTKFDLIVNLKTAKALGLHLPPTLLARADEVIE